MSNKITTKLQKPTWHRSLGAALLCAGILGLTGVTHGASINETFSSSASNFTEVAGGDWNVSGGRYVLSNPVTGGLGLLGNISVHNTTLSGDYSVSALVRIVGTSAIWDDAALIFGYQNSNNYYYVSLNESNDGNTKGVLKVVNGTPTEIADFGALSISANTDYTVEVDRTGNSIVVRINSSQVASISDSTFSGGKVGFGTKNDSAQFDNLVASDSGSGITKPNASNTGYTGSLTNSSGMTITTNGAVIQNLNITGTVHVKANNVTIRNCKIQHGGTYGIQCTYGYTGLVIEDTEITGQQSAAVYGSNFVARRLHIHDMGADAFKPGTNFTIESSYIHHLGFISGSHSDGVQMVSGGDGIIRWNNFDMPHDEPGYTNSQVILVQTNNGPIDDVLIDANWINGGSVSVQIRDKGTGHGAPTNVVITDNQFGRDYQYNIRALDGTVVWTGNVWEDDGTPAP